MESICEFRRLTKQSIQPDKVTLFVDGLFNLGMAEKVDELISQQWK